MCNRTFQASGAIDPYLRVKITAGYLALAGSTEDDVGTVASRVLAAGPAAVTPRSSDEAVDMVAAGSFAQYATLYAAASGKVDDSGTLGIGVALEASSGDGAIVKVWRFADAIVGDLARANITQQDAQVYPVLVRDLRVWDAPSTNAVAATAANDDLAVVYNTFGTAGPSVESGDSKAASTTRKVGFQFALPPEYVAGETITLRLHAGMKTTVADTSATIDAQAYRQAAPTVDICATSAESINNLVAADKDFTLTPTNCVPGDVIDVVLTVAIVDAATATAVIGKITAIQMLLDIKG